MRGFWVEGKFLEPAQVIGAACNWSSGQTDFSMLRCAAGLSTGGLRAGP
jgi:hypothetical protein